MSQGDILDLLEKEKKPLSAKEIAEKLNLSTSTIGHALRRLRDHNEVKSVQEGRYSKSGINVVRYYFL